ncbi:MAG: ABC-F family ATP-binding cassette domain-containing protein [Bauldia sp.]|nr:ABC-F family ATP-binding cassette domain-containing protein [Bauldia sp.]
MLQISDITYRIAGRTLLDHASVTIQPGARAGLVGRNGAGKSTLFGLITGILSAEDGTISVPRNWRIGEVAQEAPAGEESLLSVVLAADTERASLLRAAETEKDPNRIAEIHMRLGDIGAHSAEARAGSILSGLGFSPETMRGPCSALSGGWRMRVALAAALFAQPDLLLLDEPTNYLDLEGTLWLQTFLAKYPHSVLIVSHDRDLLDTAVDTIVHLNEGKLTLYRGGYTSFDRQRREQQALQLKMRDKQMAQRDHMMAFVERFKAKASKAKQAQSRLKALEKMEPIAELVNEHVYPFTIPDPKKPAAPPIVAMDNVTAGYQPGVSVLRGIDLTIGTDDRIGLLGQNGNGKSTLAKLISGRLQPQSGDLRLAKLKVGYFAQHQLDELNPAGSAFDHVRKLMPDVPEASVRARTGALGFPGNKMNTPTGELSGGEKARLLLGIAAFPGVNLLILDEPTNHLDIDSRQALVQALTDFAGAVIIISHDRHLLDATVDRLLLVANGTVSRFEGDMEDYRRRILEERASDGGGDKSAAGAGSKESAQERRREAAARREQAAPLRQKIKKVEALLASLHKEIQRLDGVLADPATYAAGGNTVTLRTRERADAQKKLAAAEEEWLTLSDELEAAMAG